MAGSFRLEIFEPGKADVFLTSTEAEIPWQVVQDLDEARIRVLGAPAGIEWDAERSAAMRSGCAGLVTTRAESGIAPADVAANVPRLETGEFSSCDLEGFIKTVLAERNRIRPYAFFVGRLERDFTHARHAIRAAVECEAGISCLWADDGCFRTDVESVRAETQVLIKQAVFVIADLTLGVENPKQENPSRAHEIGMAMAYERALMLCSQEPRRYPYFSIGDMQMTFWSTEQELERGVRTWIRDHQEEVGFRVYNHELPSPRIAKTEFCYDPNLRFVGPGLRRSNPLQRVLGSLGGNR